MAGATILGVVYGMKVGSDASDYVTVVEKAMEAFGAIGNTGSYLGM